MSSTGEVTFQTLREGRCGLGFELVVLLGAIACAGRRRRWVAGSAA